MNRLGRGWDFNAGGADSPMVAHCGHRGLPGIPPRGLPARKAGRYVEELINGWRSGRVGPITRRQIDSFKKVDGSKLWSGEDIHQIEELGKEVYPIVPEVLEEAAIFVWREKPWELVKEAATVYSGSLMRDEEIDSGPRLWIIPPFTDRGPQWTGILFIPVCNGPTSRAVCLVWFISSTASPYRPLAAITTDFFAVGKKVICHGRPEDSIGPLMLAATAFLRTKAARIDRQPSNRKRKKKRVARLDPTDRVRVVHLRTFEEISSSRIVDGRRPPRAHWVGLPAGFPRKYASGDVAWIEPYTRGAGDPVAGNQARFLVGDVCR